MSRGGIIAVIVAGLVLLAVPRLIGHEFYINMATQVLIYACRPA